MRFLTFQPLGIDYFCFGKKFLVFNLVSRNIKVKYRRSVLGLLWTLLAPIAMGCMYYFVFKVVLNVQVPHYLVFILSGVLPWTFFAQTLGEGMESIVGNWSLVSKIPVPIQIFPYVGSLTNLVTLGLAIPVMLGAALISGVDLGASLVMLPFYFGCLFLIAYGLSILLGLAFVYFRDLRHLLGILLQVWFYGTPVIYQEAMVPEKYRWVIFLNPVGHLFSGIHTIFAKGEWPSTTNVLVTAAWTFLLTFCSLVVFRSFGHDVVENI